MRVLASYTISAGNSADVEISNFVRPSGRNLGGRDGVIVEHIIHEDDLSISRQGDWQGGGTYNISETITSRTSGGEMYGNVLPIKEGTALQFTNDASSSQDVVAIGQEVDGSDVFFEEANGLSNNSEVTRTITGGRESETVNEFVMGGSGDVIRRVDSNDNGTFDVNSTVETGLSGDVYINQNLKMFHWSGRSNPTMETALKNTSGSAGDFMIIGVRNT